MNDITKTYTNGEVTIVWKPAMCTHATLCWKGRNGLIDVFNPMVKPWINPNGADTEKIIDQIKKCPSGALNFYKNNDEEKPVEVTGESIAETIPNGPLIIYGNITVKYNQQETKKNNVTAFCRCGASNNKPYCDGSHVKAGFTG